MATYTVTTITDEAYDSGTTTDETDDGTGLSLREAIGLANADTTTVDTIEFASNLTGLQINLTLGEITITGDVTIDGDIAGDDAAEITIDADTTEGGNDASSRIFDIESAGVDGGASVTLNALILENGVTSGIDEDGAAVRVSLDDALTLTNSTVQNNTSSSDGGGVSSEGSLIITNSSFSGNFAVDDGGGVDVDEGGATISDSSFTNNTATSAGGGLFLDDGVVTLTNLTITNNNAFEGGGAYSNTEITIESSTIDSNTASAAGGGLYTFTYSGYYAVVSNTSITNNTVTGVFNGPESTRGYGGGIYNDAHLSVFNSTISGNEVQSSLAAGGGIETRDTLIMVNSTVANNYLGGVQSYGGGIANGPGLAAYLFHTTITGNYSYNSTGGLYDNNNTTIYNSIILGNSAGTGSEVNQNPTMVYGNIIGTNIYSGSTDIGNVTVAGVFDSVSVYGGGALADNGGSVQTAALYSNLTNLAIEGGTVLTETFIGGDVDQDGTIETTELELDGRGQPRDVDSDASGTTPDLGAYEIQDILQINGTSSQDSLTGTSLNEFLVGLGDDDVLDGSGGNDTLYGNGSNDILVGGAGSDFLIGGDGTDTADYRTNTEAVTIDLDANTASGGDAAGDTFSTIERVIGTGFADTITGDSSNNLLRGEDGVDILNGLTGNDILRGGEDGDTMDGGTGLDWLDYQGSDAAVTVSLTAGTASGGHADGDSFSNMERIIGSSFDDTLTGDGNNNYLIGGDGVDTLNGLAGIDVLRGGDGADILDGGSDDDWLDYQGSSSAVTISLDAGTASGGDATGDTFSNMERIIGSSHDDSLTGDSGINYLRGESGADTLNGLGGTDFLRGGDGGDVLNGGDNDDWLDYRDSSAAVTISLDAGTASGGHATGDTFSNVERIIGSDFDDTLTGDSGTNYLRGEAGTDTLNGLGGVDVLRGGDGGDVLNGGDGSDWLDYQDSTAGVTISLAASTASGGYADGDTFSSIESIIGSSSADDLTGNSGINALKGEGGDDTLIGVGGDDVLFGGDGNDTFVFSSGDGNDTISTSFDGGSGAGDVIRLLSISGFTSFTDIQNNSDDSSGSTVITLSASQTITIENTLITDLASDDFLFS